MYVCVDGAGTAGAESERVPEVAPEQSVQETQTWAVCVRDGDSEIQTCVCVCVIGI